IPCCDSAEPATWDQSEAWIQARGTVAGVAALPNGIETDRPIADDATAPNCFGGAFATATATLEDRIKTYGATSPWVKAWVDGQDAVFDACHGTATAMPALDAAAPHWLAADRA